MLASIFERSVAIVLLAMVAAAGCSGPSHAPASGEPVPQVGSVLVTMANELPAERQARLEQG